MTLSIQTQGLRRSFGNLRAVDGIDLAVPTGSVFGFLGPNGSGKTTTIRLLLGLIRADAGAIALNGVDLWADRSGALSGVGAIVETPSLYVNLTGREVLRITALLLALKISEIDRVLDIVDLKAAADRRVRTYSLGMRQRLAIARALMGTPKLLMLDEPTNGLDPAGMKDMRQLIKDLPNRSSTTVFVSSHQLSEMEQMTDHCALIKSGKILFQGRLDTLMAQASAPMEVETDQPDRAYDIAVQMGIKGLKSGANLLVETQLDRAGRAALIKALVEAGCAVSAANQREARLEDLFLTLTSD